MTEATLLYKKEKNSVTDLNKVVFVGFLLRVIALFFIIGPIFSHIEPYFVFDDIKYEESAKFYLKTATSVFDIVSLKDVSDAYIAPFWPLVLCFLSYIFKSVYVGRFLNVILSTFTIKIIYNLTFVISKENKTALLSAKLFAYLPLTVLISCFSIKDVFISFAVIYFFYIMVLIEKCEKIGVVKPIFAVVLLIFTYYSRGGVAEMMLIFFACFLMKRFFDTKHYLSAVFLFGAIIIAFMLWGTQIIGAFKTKIDDYGGEGTGEGGVAFLTMNSIFDIYKLPFSCFFASLQPIKMNLFTPSSVGFWHNVIAHLNLTMYPIAIANFIYIFVKKHDFMFWLLGMVIYVSVINLSLGVFRHYIFLVPLILINAALCLSERKSKLSKQIIILGTLTLLIIMLSYTLLYTIR